MTIAVPWSPAQYDKFKQERQAPFDDALALIGSDIPNLRGAAVLDLGCGTGELTARLASHLPTANVLGIDTSPHMLERAQTLAAPPRLRFIRAAIEAIDQLGASPDLDGDQGHAGAPRWHLIFSHAALHWVPEHRRLIPRLLTRLHPGGRLVAQLPSNHGHVSHLALRELALEGPFRDALEGRLPPPSPVLATEQYATLLHEAGASDITVFEKVYLHVLPDADAVVDWMRGTAVIPWLERLPPDLHGPFVEHYRARLRAELPDRPVVFPFKRIFLAATAAR